MYYNEISLSLCSDRISAKVPVARLVKLNWIFCNTCPSSEFQTEKWKCESRSPEYLIITQDGFFLLNHELQITRCCQIFIILSSPNSVVCFLYFRAGLFANRLVQSLPTDQHWQTADQDEDSFLATTEKPGQVWTADQDKEDRSRRTGTGWLRDATGFPCHRLSKTTIPSLLFLLGFWSLCADTL